MQLLHNLRAAQDDSEGEGDKSIDTFRLTNHFDHVEDVQLNYDYENYSGEKAHVTQTK